MRRPKCHPTRPYGAKGLCRPCYGKAYREANREHIRARNKAYHEAPRETTRFDDAILQEKLDYYSMDVGEHRIWCGNLDRDGYGRVSVGGGSMKASRLAWELAYGPIPPGMWVLHRNPCHHPACVRFDHLYLGTARENGQDTTACGSQRHPNKGNTLAVNSRGDEGDQDGT